MPSVSCPAYSYRPQAKGTVLPSAVPSTVLLSAVPIQLSTPGQINCSFVSCPMNCSFIRCPMNCSSVSCPAYNCRPQAKWTVLPSAVLWTVLPSAVLYTAVDPRPNEHGLLRLGGRWTQLPFSAVPGLRYQEPKGDRGETEETVGHRSRHIRLFGQPSHWQGTYRSQLFRNHTELRSCVKVEVAVPNKPTISVDVKQRSTTTEITRDYNSV